MLSVSLSDISMIILLLPGQVAADHITVVDHESIQDGHTTDWDESEVLRILTAEVEARSIDTARPCQPFCRRQLHKRQRRCVQACCVAHCSPVQLDKPLSDKWAAADHHL